MKIKYKILLITVLVSLGALIIFGFISYYSMKKVLTEEITNKLIAISKIQKARLHNLVNQNTERLVLIKSRTQLRISLNNYINSGDRENINKIVRILNDAKASIEEINSISVLTLDGKVVASTDSKEKGAIYKNDEFFTRGQNENVTDIFYINDNNKLVMQLSGPLMFNDKLIGVLLININADNLTFFVNDYSGLGETGYTRIVKKCGDAFIVSSHRTEKQQTIFFDIEENICSVTEQSLQKGMFVLKDVIDCRNKRVIAVTDFIEGTDIGLNVRISHSEAFSNLFYLKKVMIVVSTLFVIIIIVFSLFFSNTLVKPIVLLSRLADDISKGNLDKKITIKSHDEIGLLTESFNQMSENILFDINERVIVEKELIKSKNELQLNYSSLKAVQNISNAVHQPNDLLKLAKASVDALINYTGSPTVVIFTYEKNNDYVKYFYSKDLPKEVLNTIKQLPLDGSLSGITVKTKKVQISEDMIGDNRLNLTAKTEMINSEFKSILSIPIIYQDKVFGVMNLFFNKKQTFSNIERDTFFTIGKTIGMAFSNVKYLDNLKREIEERKLSEEKINELIKGEKKRTTELEESYKQLEQAQDASLNMLNDLNNEIAERKRAEQIQKVLYNISNAVITTDNLEELVKQIQEELGTIIDTKNFYIALYDHKTDMLTLPFYADEKDKFTSVPAGKTLTKYVIETKKPLLANIDLKKKLVKEGKLEHKGSLSKIWLGVPLKVEKEIIGVLAVQSYTDEFAYDESDMKILEFISDQISLSIDLKKTEEKLDKYRDHLEELVKKRTEELSFANAELEKAAGMKDEFLANMSHELRTPLNAVLGLSEALQEEIYGKLNKKQTKKIQNIEESGRHLLSLINEILDLAKIEAGKIVLEYHQISIEELMQSSLRFIKQIAFKKKIKVSTSISGTIETFRADEKRMKQILVNLLSNAVKFTPDGGKIGLEVKVNEENQTISFIVWDTGIGIAHENLDKLFLPFVQIDSTLSRQYEGTGLGLALVEKLVNLHNGSITVGSKKGKGSRFVVTIPIMEYGKKDESELKDSKIDKLNSESDVLIVKEDVQEQQGRKELILLAEDNEYNITTIKDYLEAKQFKVLVARNGKEAAEKARELKPNLILMDVQMPVMNGLEATKEIKASNNSKISGIPIIALTSLAMPGDRERCLNAGADEYMKKPVVLKNLVKTINEFLKKKA